MKRCLTWLAAQTPLEVLGLTDAGRVYTAREVKEAFYRQAQVLHPDKEGGSEEKFKELVASYESLSPSSGDVPRMPSPPSSGTEEARQQREDHYREYNAYRQQHREETGGDTPNFSTWYFYRQYGDAQDTGFTASELRDAQRATRRYLAWRVVKSFLLFASVLYLCYLHAKNDRLAAAKAAREGNYASAAYWAAVDRDRASANALRMPSRRASPTSEGADRSSLPRWPNERHPPAGTRLPDGSTQVFGLRYKGQPFTPEGVRSASGAKSNTEKDSP